MILFQDVLIFAYGLIPQYAGVAVVERHYTANWTAFWNVFGISAIAWDFALSSMDQSRAIVFGVIAILLSAVVYFSWGGGEDWYNNVDRKIGMSWSSILVSWTLIGFYLEGFVADALLFTLFGVLSVLIVILLARS